MVFYRGSLGLRHDGRFSEPGQPSRIMARGDAKWDAKKGSYRTSNEFCDRPSFNRQKFGLHARQVN